MAGKGMRDAKFYVRSGTQSVGTDDAIVDTRIADLDNDLVRD
jgi:hypothetical protein